MEEDKKKSHITFTIAITTTIILLLIILIGFFIVRYFISGSNNTNLLPRLTLDLYDDLDAFMQYDY